MQYLIPFSFRALPLLAAASSFANVIATIGGNLVILLIKEALLCKI